MSDRTVCFGELLLRLAAPGKELLLQSPTLTVHVGGAEANVAVSLQHFGHEAAFVSVVPDSTLGRACVRELMRHGVDTRGVRLSPGRMGLYFMTHGAMQRPAEIEYDRSASAFALAPAELFDWSTLLRGARWLHISGITLAVSRGAADAALLAMTRARALGVGVSFDCNYRERVWGPRAAEAPRILRAILPHVELLFANERDLALVLGRELPPAPAPSGMRDGGLAAFHEFPSLRRICMTHRDRDSVDTQRLSASLHTRERAISSRAHSLSSIVDRIGAGDAFAAGMLHGLLTEMDDAASLEFALAAACLKHSIPGDFNLASVADVEGLLKGAGVDVRR